jgi:cobalt-factor III methyltransferase
MKGVLNLVSVGPGFAGLIVPRAEAVLRDSDVIVAYDLYLRWIEPWITNKEIHTPPLTHELERALLAIEKASPQRRKGGVNFQRRYWHLCHGGAGV